MEGNCSRYDKCASYALIGCNGCGFQHFDNILMNHPENEALRSLADKFYIQCSERRHGQGGRVSLDASIKELFLQRIPELKQIPVQNLRVELPINGETVRFEVKCDGALESGGTHVFYEVKGYGDNTNDVLSAITAAQLLREIPNYRKSLYYYIYIGISSAINKGGLTRNDFFDEKRTKISPYVKWAESKGFLEFYGIVDIEDLLEEIKRIIHRDN